MAKYRLEFSKEGDAKFVSHLDLVRLFTRVFKRARLPLAYSEGFNPHPKMSIGIPLSVGVTSEAELLDAEFYEEVPALEIKERMNETMPIGIAITKVQMLEQGMPKLSSVSRASYRVSLSGDGVAKEALAEFLKRETIEIEKKTKRSEKLVDIKPDIFGILWEDETTLVMTLATGSAANLKPEVVLSAMKLYIPGCSGEAAAVHRLSMTDDNGCALIAG
ncbi:MAG: DUF2344 domain-containing protein [Clostridia bacterium]|nr:DUF2344 domain-containing protein [Clostridia bacterium]